MKALAKKCETSDKLKTKFKNHVCTFFSNSLAKSFVTPGLANYFALTNASASTFVSCAMSALLVEIVMNIDPTKVAANYPSRTILSNVVMDKGID